MGFSRQGAKGKIQSNGLLVVIVFLFFLLLFFFFLFIILWWVEFAPVHLLVCPSIVVRFPKHVRCFICCKLGENYSHSQESGISGCASSEPVACGENARSDWYSCDHEDRKVGQYSQFVPTSSKCVQGGCVATAFGNLGWSETTSSRNCSCSCDCCHSINHGESQVNSIRQWNIMFPSSRFSPTAVIAALRSTKRLDGTLWNERWTDQPREWRNDQFEHDKRIPDSATSRMRFHTGESGNPQSRTSITIENCTARDNKFLPILQYERPALRQILFVVLQNRIAHSKTKPVTWHKYLLERNAHEYRKLTSLEKDD